MSLQCVDISMFKNICQVLTIKLQLKFGSCFSFLQDSFIIVWSSWKCFRCWGSPDCFWKWVRACGSWKMGTLKQRGALVYFSHVQWEVGVLTVSPLSAKWERFLGSPGFFSGHPLNSSLSSACHELLRRSSLSLSLLLSLLHTRSLIPHSLHWKQPMSD